MAGIPGKLGRLLDECDSLLQVALDFTRIYDALKVAAQLPKSKAVVLEAGTPLIKSFGSEAVYLLRALAGEGAVMADLKTMDTGALEVDIAADAGADATSVLALAPEETIKGAVERAEARGIALYGDLIGHPSPLEGLRALKKLGVHIALLHVGIDVQRTLGLTAPQMLELLGEAVEEFGGPVAVAGGVKPSDVGALVDAGARIIIIGSAITRASEPRDATVEALKYMGVKC